MFTALRKWTYMGSLKNWSYLTACDSATLMISIEYNRLERTLAKALRRQSWITVYRTRSMPRCGYVYLGMCAKDLVE